jgi:hypothetical protein
LKFLLLVFVKLDADYRGRAVVSLYAFVPETIEKMCCFWLKNGGKSGIATPSEVSDTKCAATHLKDISVYFNVQTRISRELTMRPIYAWKEPSLS